MDNSMPFVRAGGVAAAITLALAAPSPAAEIGGVGSPAVLVDPMSQSWGGASDTALIVGVGEIVPRTDTVTWNTSNAASTGMAMYQTSPGGSGSWVRQVHLPSGALLQRIELEACDNSATGGLGFGMTSGLVPGTTAADITPVGTTGLAAAPGCAFFSVTPTATTAVDNAARNYWLFMFWDGTWTGSTVAFHSFRVYYRLQVSPAPAVATFPADVPTTHPIFRFVEAMAASGLTGGCGAGRFCPDSPVTRGQLSVFLSAALGLHFPN